MRFTATKETDLLTHTPLISINSISELDKTHCALSWHRLFVFFLRERLLTARHIRKLAVHPLTAVGNCLINVFPDVLLQLTAFYTSSTKACNATMTKGPL